MAFTRIQLTHRMQSHVATHLFDESGCEALGAAIYTLSDPRSIREVRYVGQSTAPQRRFFQHLNAARLWLPEETPWWIKSPKLRPLYAWIRALHREDDRLPVMVIQTWIAIPEQVREAERRHIYECLQKRLPLLNFESESLGKQLSLL